MASSSVRSQSPFTQSKRVPLSELPLRAFVSRPPSPIKSYSSPCKINTNSSAAVSRGSSSNTSPSRTNSLPIDRSSDTTAKSYILFREAIRKADASDIPLEESRPIETKGKGRMISVFASPHAVKSTSSSTSSSPSKTSQSTSRSSPLSFSPTKPGLHSLARKKDRLRRQLLDEDEEGTALEISSRPNTPSPRKSTSLQVLTESKGMNSTQEQASKSRLNPQGIKWEVWQGATDDVLVEAGTPQPANEDDEGEEKENVGLSDSIINNRKKGTGGRLSLLATASEISDGDQSTDFQGKRRRTTAEIAGSETLL